MKRKKGILKRAAEVRARRGDALNLAGDWRALATLAEATWRRYECEQSGEAVAAYLDVLAAMAPVVGAKDASDFRARHRELVKNLSPGLGARKAARDALRDPPRLSAGPC